MGEDRALFWVPEFDLAGNRLPEDEGVALVSCLLHAQPRTRADADLIGERWLLENVYGGVDPRRATAKV